MTRKQLFLSTTLCIATLPGGFVTAFAQPPAQPQSATSNAQAASNRQVQSSGGQDEQQSADGQAEAPRQMPILAVTGVEIIRSSHGGQIDIVRATGVASSGNWSSPTLTPITSGPPSDGVLDIIFHADTQADSTEVDGLHTVEAVLTIDREDAFKGVRVRSATNVIALKTWPGFAEVPPPVDPCVQCVGKLLIAKGAATPTGVTGADAVREEDLPRTARIIKPTDGVSDLPWDPNRLTLLIGDDGKILDAAWN